MDFRKITKLLLVVAVLAALVPDLDAQRRGKGKRKGGLRPKAGSFLGRPIPPVKLPKIPQLLPESARSVGTSLLPDATTTPLTGSVPGTDIELPRERSVIFWTDPRDPELEQYYFGLCDHDENEWISFREAAFSLGLSRSQFGYYDKDRDGRIQRSEFGTRYALIVDRAGAFPPPRPLLVASSEPNAASGGTDELPEGVRTEEQQLLDRFDTNQSRALELGELPALIAFWQLTEYIEPEQLLGALDTNETTSALELSEMPQLIESMALAQYKFLKNIISLDTLFNLSVTPITEGLGLGPGRAPLPTIGRLRGPTDHFRRLDQNGDGVISAGDLSLLQSPMHLSVRTNAVIAAIDRDGDGAISKEEFRAALD